MVRCCRAVVSGQHSLRRAFGTIPDGLPVTFQDISRAAYTIRGGVERTPSVRAHELMEKHCGMSLWLKREVEHHTGSFKERGARNALSNLSDEEKKIGTIAASAGNHALAMSWHGRDLGIPVTVVMPTLAPLTKVENCRTFGGNVVIHGEHIGEAKDHAMTAPQFEGMTYINGYDHKHIVAGAGTMGLEILDEVPDVDAVVVPVGGAGLIAGTALAIKTLKPDVEVIGVEPFFCASYMAALAAGEVVAAPFTPTLADGLAVPIVGPQAFEVARHTVDQVVCVDEKQIALAILRLCEMEKTVVEGGGATGLAAVLPGGPLHEQLKGKNVVLPLCGGNIDITVLGRVIDRGLAADDRLVRFVATVNDRPGGIAKLATLIAEEGASVKDTRHERAWVHNSMNHVQVRFIVETTGTDHEQRLRRRLENEDYPLLWGAEMTKVMSKSGTGAL